MGVSAWSVWCVWRRNVLVWRKLAVPSLLGNVADPLMSLMAFGLGLGALIGGIEGEPYIKFLAIGSLCVSAMNAATFEALYSAFSRMHAQKTWDSIMNTPVRLQEVVLGEWIWAATKSGISTACMMTVVAILGVGSPMFWLGGWCFLWSVSLCFSAWGLCVNAKARGYDFFMFYFTLVITPMTFLSGAFFPRTQLPSGVLEVANVLPLSLAVDGLRAMVRGDYAAVWIPLTGLLVYGALGLWVALRLTQARFVKA